MSKKLTIMQGIVVLAGSMLAGNVMSAEKPATGDSEYSLVPKLRIQVNNSQKNISRFFNSELLEPEFDSRQPPTRLNQTELQQYDATLFYPITAQWINLDLGLNMKYLNVSTNYMQNGQYQSHNFSAAIPMFYATALFNLPFEGLTAGIEGKHHLGLDSNNNLTGYDFKAKISYEWSKGFGLQGGWQHQQFSLDNNDNSSADYERKGPFLDFYLRF